MSSIVMSKKDAKKIFAKEGRVFPRIHMVLDTFTDKVRMQTFVRVKGLDDGKYYLVFLKNFWPLGGQWENVLDCKTEFDKQAILTITHYIVTPTDISFLDPLQKVHRYEP